MKLIQMTPEEFRQVSDDQLTSYSVALWGGSNDVYVYDGEELKHDFISDSGIQGNPDFYEVLVWHLKGKSGNSFELLKAVEGAITKVEILFDKEILDEWK